MSLDVQRWNFSTHEYEPHEFPDGWNCPLYIDDFDRIINCASCGTELKFGATFTSKRLHNSIGFGYGVCGICYQQEWKERHAHEGLIATTRDGNA